MKSKKPTRKKVQTRHAAVTKHSMISSTQSTKTLVPLVGIFLGVTVLFAAVYMYSLQPTLVKAIENENAAIVSVRTLPAVKEQTAKLQKAGAKVGFRTVKRDDGNWNVQMFEDQKERNVTVNWFVMNSDTGNLICSMFDLKTSKLNDTCSL